MENKRTKTSVFRMSLIVFLFFTFIINAQSSLKINISNFSPKIDSLFQKWNTNNTPGLSVAISENNNILYSKSFGMANLNDSTKITSETSFNIASLTKQFVAYAILLLEQEGKLSLDENIQEYLPELQYSGVKVRHLLNHTSGIPEHWGIWSLSNFKGENISDIYNIHKSQIETKFIPGSEYEYSNSNYVLLTILISKLSGQSTVSFMREHIFDKLGMEHTYFLIDPSKNSSNQAENYQFDGQKYIAIPQVVSDIIGDGGLYSSIEDIQLWNKAFYDNSPIAVKRREEGILNSEKSSFYGFGLQKFVNNGIVSYEHGGGAQGVSCYFAQFPEQKVSITILANTDEVNAMAFFAELKIIVFQTESNALTNSSNTNSIKNWDKLDSNTLKSFEGKYYGFSSEVATSFDIAVASNDTLIGKSFGNPSRKYTQTNSNEFSATNLPDLKLKLKSNLLSIHYQQFDLGILRKINEVKIIETPRIIGNYSSPSINNANWNITTLEKEITVTTPKNKTYSLISLGSNLFQLKEINMLLLFMDNDGVVSLKLIHQGVGELMLKKNL